MAFAPEAQAFEMVMIGLENQRRCTSRVHAAGFDNALRASLPLLRARRFSGLPKILLTQGHLTTGRAEDNGQILEA